jgi:ATP adenylyltransferase
MKEFHVSLNERLWAPWRLPYIQNSDDHDPETTHEFEIAPGGDPECFLCQAAVDHSEEADRIRYTVERTENTVVVLNRFPYNNGHLLIAPRRHLGRLDAIAPETHAALTAQITRWSGILEKVMTPEGFNIGLNLGHAAGAGLPGHLHWHIVPRWNGDTNFMPALGNIKVIPQSLEALWEILTTEAKGSTPDQLQD